MTCAILIVEDDTDKLRRIMLGLEPIAGIDLEAVDTVIDAHSAKLRMQIKAYDLLILDISIPPRRSAEVEPHGGLTLLDEVMERPHYHTPTHIIALTAHEDVFPAAKAQLAENVLSLIYYKVGSDEWQRQLRGGVEQRLSAKRTVGLALPSYDFDVAFICALRTECAAVRANGWIWALLEVPHDDSLYYEASFAERDGRTGRAVAVVSARMGMPAAAAATMKLIMRFRPRYLFMTGIMGGVANRTNLGDLIVANPVWDWVSGKWIVVKQPANGDEASDFEADPYQFRLDNSLERMALQLEEDKAELYKIRHGFGMGAPDRDLKVHIGAVASRAAVLANQSVLDRVKEQHRKLLGVEMEAYGVFTAAAESPQPRPLCMCIKTVVDFADGRKDDTYQAYGTYASAKAAQYFVEKFCN